MYTIHNKKYTEDLLNVQNQNLVLRLFFSDQVSIYIYINANIKKGENQYHKLGISRKTRHMSTFG